MTTLITGAGMLGVHLAKDLADQGEEVVLFELNPVTWYINKVAGSERVRVVRGDVTNLGDLVSALQQSGADCLVHTVGLLGAAVAASPYTAVKVNTGGTVNAIEAARLTGVKRMVFASTMGVYDVTASAPMNEVQMTAPNSLYGATKLAAERLALQYGAHYGVEVIALRYPVGYGYTFSAAGTPFGSVIYEVVAGPAEGRAVTVERSPLWMGYNEFVYAKDMARAAALAVRAEGLTDHIFNIGTGVLKDLADIAAAVKEEIPDAQITINEPNGTVKESATRFPFDLVKAGEQLGYKPSFFIPEAVKDYIASVRAS